MFVDVHCHLEHDRYQEDFADVLARAKEAGVTSIITSGVNPASNRKALQLAKKHDIVNCSLGLYPVDAIACCIPKKEITDDVVRHIEPFDVDKELAFIAKQKDKITAIGEIGLDNKVVKGRQKEQEDVFFKAIATAQKIKKPIVVHTRSAEAACLDAIESSGIKKVNMHCFGGKLKLVKRGIDMGLTFSVPAVITRLKHFQELVKLVPLQQLLTETDGPYLAPVAGGRSEPSDVVNTVKIISEIKGLDFTETRNIIYMNYQKLFM